MRILYVGMADDYGDPSRGPSFEELNFRSSLAGMGHEVIPFDFMARMKRDGTEAMRKDLVGFAAETRPDLSFFLLFTDELDVPTIRAVGRAGGAPTVNWFADDHWRFEGFSRHLAPAFDLAVTTDPDALPKYSAAGIDNVHLSQWACNRYAYSKVVDAIQHEVTFVGQPHGDRRVVIDRLRAAGHQVECWGFGWPSGRIDNAEMVRVFSTSRVNLNLSNSSTPQETLRMRMGRRLGRGPAEAPPRGSRPPQIKGRNFEVPGCGGFLLTERVPHLERYFKLDREVGVFADADDLVEKVDFWLTHDDERTAVAMAGHRRVLAEHTYDHRFAAIFGELGLADRSHA